jgi:hypothetical protein
MLGGIEPGANFAPIHSCIDKSEKDEKARNPILFGCIASFVDLGHCPSHGMGMDSRGPLDTSFHAHR